mgnify:FL=1|jgi:hypothetical protein|tara:strand:+ start:109 stop:405 length:297 start_codon:yes stop_codon:yes gene_type:complete
MASSNVTIKCWKCGATLRNLLLHFFRYEECSTCNADLYACISFEKYAPHPKNLADSCSEDCAESVLDNEKANFCDFIKVNPNAYRKKDEAPAMAAQAF